MQQQNKLSQACGQLVSPLCKNCQELKWKTKTAEELMWKEDTKSKRWIYIFKKKPATTDLYKYIWMFENNNETWDIWN